jgi:hypothetical protein
MLVVPELAGDSSALSASPDQAISVGASHPLGITTHSQSRRKAKTQFSPAITGGGALILLVALVALCGGLFGWYSPSPERTRRQVIAELDHILNRDRQRIFNSIHPIGQAQRIEVHDAQVVAGRGGEPLLQFRYTIFWKGPVTTDGFTTVVQLLSLESKRVVETQVVNTNGLTNQDAGQLAIEFATGYLEELSRQEQLRQRYGR